MNKKRIAQPRPEGWVDPRLGIDNKYKPEVFIPLVLEVGRKGQAWAEFCVLADITPDTYYRYIKKYPEFEEAVIKAKLLAKVYWLNFARENLENPDLNYKLYRVLTRASGTDCEAIMNQRIKSVCVQAQFKSLCKSVDDGGISSQDIKSLSDIIELNMKVVEHEVLCKQVEELKRANDIK